MVGKAPSEGTKVTMGENAPAYQESTGSVPSGSLASESASRGGEFGQNRGVTRENPSAAAGDDSSAQSSRKHPGPGDVPASQSSQTSQGAAAPSYVNNQYIRDSSGPHGKNLHEGIDYSNTEDGTQKAMNAEPGSKNDPARLAEQQFLQSQTRAAGDTGPKQQQRGEKTVYDALNSNAQA